MAEGFAAQVESWATKADERTRRVVRRWMINLHEELIAWTPVDTGRLQSNFYITEGSPSGAFDPDLHLQDPQAAHAAQIGPVANFTGDKVMFITSNTPYAWEIEFTDKSKKGKGMFRKTGKLGGRLLGVSVTEEPWR